MDPKNKKSGDADVLRVVLADDHQIVRNGIATILSTIERVHVVGQASNGIELLTLVDQLAPTLVITDISMPKMNGIEALKQLKRSHPKLPVLVLSMHDGPEVASVVMRGGAAGCISKDSTRQELVQAIEGVRDTGSYRPEQPVAAWRERSYRGIPADVLTQRQLEILQMLAKGMAAKEIAFKLNLSAKTVHTHRAAIMVRTGCRDIPSLTLYAMRTGLIDS